MKFKKQKISLILLTIFVLVFIIISLSVLSNVILSFKSNKQSQKDDIYETLDLSQYVDHGDFGDEDVIWIKKEDYTGIQYGVINTKGEFVIPLTSKIVGVYRMSFENGFSIAYMDSSERSEEENSDENFAVIFNANGQIVNKFEFIGRSEYKYLNNGNIYMRTVAPYGTREVYSNAYMFCAGSGNIVSVPLDSFRDPVGMYSDGLLYIKCGYGYDVWEGVNYFDAEGNCVLNVDNSNEYYKQVLSASDFNDGTATVWFVGLDNNKYYVDIDKTGKWLNEPTIFYD